MLPVRTLRILILGMACSTVFVSCVLGSDAEPHKSWEIQCPFKVEAYQMTEDFGSAPPYYDCALQYYYYVPCPTYSWFWAYSGWSPGDLIGACFTVGDRSTGGFDICTGHCYYAEGIRVLDFAGYGTVYPGVFTLEMDLYCGDFDGVPYVHLWNSGPLETHFGWNYFEIDPPVELGECPDFADRGLNSIVATMTMTGPYGIYPRVAFDNVSTPAEMGCQMLDRSSSPAVYPRKPAGSVGTSVRSGYIGTYPFEHWPPVPFPDGKHADDEVAPRWYGYTELAWRLYIGCDRPTGSGR